MKYVFRNTTYEFSSNHLFVNGKECKSKTALYQTIINLLHQVNYKFDLEHQCPLVLRIYREVPYKTLYIFASNLIPILCGCGSSGLEWLQACKLSPDGRFYTLLDNHKVFAYELYNRYHCLINSGSTYRITELEDMVHNGAYIIIR